MTFQVKDVLQVLFQMMVTKPLKVTVSWRQLVDYVRHVLRLTILLIILLKRFDKYALPQSLKKTPLHLRGDLLRVLQYKNFSLKCFFLLFLVISCQCWSRSCWEITCICIRTVRILICYSFFTFDLFFLRMFIFHIFTIQFSD